MLGAIATGRTDAEPTDETKEYTCERAGIHFRNGRPMKPPQAKHRKGEQRYAASDAGTASDERAPGTPIDRG
jgi:hypothetical protein